MLEEGKGGDAKTCFSAGTAAHIHHFKDIRQGTLQFDCVMLFGAGLGMTRAGWFGMRLSWWWLGV